MRTGWENLSDVFMQIGSQYRENKQREYDRAHQLEMLRAQLLNQAEMAKQQQNHELEMQSRDAASAMERLQKQIESTENIAEQRNILDANMNLLNNAFGVLRQNIEGRQRLEQIEAEGPWRVKAAEAGRSNVNIGWQQQKFDRELMLTLSTEMENRRKEILGFLDTAEDLDFEALQSLFNSSLGKKLPFKKELYKELSPTERKALLHSYVDFYLGQKGLERGRAMGLEDNSIIMSLGQQYFGEEPNINEYLKKHQMGLGEKPKPVEKAKEIGQVIPAFPPFPVSVGQVIEGAQGLFGPKMPETLDRPDLEMAFPGLGGTPPEAEAEEGPLPGESREDWLKRIMQGVGGIFKRK